MDAGDRVTSSQTVLLQTGLVTWSPGQWGTASVDTGGRCQEARAAGPARPPRPRGQGLSPTRLTRGVGEREKPTAGRTPRTGSPPWLWVGAKSGPPHGKRWPRRGGEAEPPAPGTESPGVPYGKATAEAWIACFIILNVWSSLISFSISFSFLFFVFLMTIKYP